MPYPIQSGSLSGQRKLGKLPNTPTGRSSIAAAAWTHEGTYLIYGFLASISDQGIPVEYELDTFNTPPQEQFYVTPKIGYIDAMPNPALGT